MDFTISDRTATLVAAYVLISDRRRWTKKAEGRDYQHSGVDGDDPKAVQWCAIGTLRAVHAAPMNRIIEEAEQLLDDISVELFGAKHPVNCVVDVNDVLGYANTMEVFETAICVSEKMDERDEHKRQSRKHHTTHSA